MHLTVQEDISYLVLHSNSVSACRKIDLDFSSERGQTIIFNSGLSLHPQKRLRKPKTTYHLSDKICLLMRVDNNAGRAETSRACLIGRLDTDAPDARAPHRYRRIVIETLNQEPKNLAISTL